MRVTLDGRHNRPAMRAVAKSAAAIASERSQIISGPAPPRPSARLHQAPRAPRECRSARPWPGQGQVARRARIVQACTRTKNQIHTMLRANLILPYKGDIFSRISCFWLASQPHAVNLHGTGTPRNIHHNHLKLHWKPAMQRVGWVQMWSFTRSRLAKQINR